MDGGVWQWLILGAEYDDGIEDEKLRFQGGSNEKGMVLVEGGANDD